MLVLWLHVVSVVVWLGGVAHQSHVVLPAARARDADLFAAAARRARRVAWPAVAVVALTGFYNVTRLGPLERVLESGAGLLLAGKFLLVLAAVAVAAQRDFAQIPRLCAALAARGDPTATLRTIVWHDRIVLSLGLVIIYLGLAISRS